MKLETKFWLRCTLVSAVLIGVVIGLQIVRSDQLQEMKLEGQAAKEAYRDKITTVFPADFEADEGTGPSRIVIQELVGVGMKDMAGHANDIFYKKIKWTRADLSTTLINIEIPQKDYELLSQLFKAKTKGE